MTPSDRRKEYLSQRILTASPMELIRLLYESAIQTVDEALLAHRSRDIYGRGHAVSKAVGILSELLVSLRHDVRREYSGTLAELYGYMQRQLIRAHSEQSEEPLREVSRLLNTLLEGWTGAMEKNTIGDREQSSSAPEPETVEVRASNPYSTGTGGLEESRSWKV
jgi:flagellar protein FliS